MEWLCNYRLNLAGVLGKPRISKLELGNSQPLDLSMALIFRAWRSPMFGISFWNLKSTWCQIKLEGIMWFLNSTVVFFCVLESYILVFRIVAGGSLDSTPSHNSMGCWIWAQACGQNFLLALQCVICCRNFSLSLPTLLSFSPLPSSCYPPPPVLSHLVLSGH